MTHRDLEFGNIIVVILTSIAVYFIPTNFAMLLVIPAVGFQIYVFQKYYEAHEARFEYEYAAVSLALFAAAFFVPAFLFKSIVVLAILNLSRSGISLYSVGERETSEKLVEKALAEMKVNMQQKMEQLYSAAQEEVQASGGLSDEDILQKVANIRVSLLAEEQNKIRELEQHYADKISQLQASGQQSLAELNTVLAEKEQEIAYLREQTDAIVNKYLEEYREIIARKNVRIKSLEKENKDQAKQIKEQKQTIDNLLSKQDDFIAQLEMHSQDRKNTIISNKEIHAKLLAVLREAKHEVNIMSPWVNREIVNSIFEDNLEMLMRKNGRLKVVYGINMKEDDAKRLRAEKILKGLQKKYGKDKIQFKYFSSHSKLIICDDEYYIITSCNPLSNDGMSWEEIGEISGNKKNLAAYKKKYFSDF